MEALVVLKQVVKRYRRGRQVLEVLHNLDLEVAAGEFLALMGPSGSGKTTLLNLIGGLDRPTEGEVDVGGERIDQLSSGQLAAWRARHVGFVFQFYNLMPTLSAERNVGTAPVADTALGRPAQGQCRGGPDAGRAAGLAQAQAERAFRRSAAARRHRPRHHRRPTLLVCDEPTGDLDRETAEEVLGLLQQLNKGHGKTSSWSPTTRRRPPSPRASSIWTRGALVPAPAMVSV